MFAKTPGVAKPNIGTTVPLTELVAWFSPNVLLLHGVVDPK
jgi:hypothetical protein